MAKLHAIEYLGQPDKYPPKPVCVAFGDDLFLRRQVLLGLRHAVLGGDEGDFSLTSFEGRTAEFRDVVEELTTTGHVRVRRRLVVVDGGRRAFVSRDLSRRQLEDYVARPGRSGILVLDVKSWPSNTRLYKAVDAQGLAVDCSAPTGGERCQLAQRLGQADPQVPAFARRGGIARRDGRAGAGPAGSGVGQVGPHGGQRQERSRPRWSRRWAADGGRRRPGTCSTWPWTGT